MTGSGKSGLTYADAGVDIAAGNALVDAIKPLAKATRRSGADASLGGFGALFDLKAAGFRDPVLVSSTDGVGTKLLIAIETGRHDTVGIDLVAMCVNDLVVQGAEPLFFLDYFATGKLSVEAARDVVKGIAEGCSQAGCALVGGETAEMPGMYAAGHFDLAGFSVGAVERDAVLPRADVADGDLILGLPASGFHSNGYSLVRRLVAEAGLGWDDPAPFADGQSVAEALLAPTRIYVKAALAAIRTGGVKALAHITGGGITENLPRVLPEGTVAEVDLGAWTPPACFGWAKETGRMEAGEMLRTFNMGLGMMLVVAPEMADAVRNALRGEGEAPVVCGRIAAREDGPAVVRYTGEVSWA